MELVEPTYKDVKNQIKNFDILFCAPNHQTFIIDEDFISTPEVETINKYREILVTNFSLKVGAHFILLIS